MDRYVYHGNIGRYRKLLDEEIDEEKRIMIRRLLSEEEAREIPPDPKRQDGKSERLQESGATHHRPAFMTVMPAGPASPPRLPATAKAHSARDRYAAPPVAF